MPMENCKILFWEEIFAIEQAGTQLNKDDYGAIAQTPTKRRYYLLVTSLENRMECYLRIVIEVVQSNV